MLSLLLLFLNVLPATAQTVAAPPTLLIIDTAVAPDDASLIPSDWEAMESITYNPNPWLRDSKRVSLKTLHQQMIERHQQQDDHGSNVSHLARRYSGNSRILAMPGGIAFSSVMRTNVSRGIPYTFFRESTVHHLFKDELQELKDLITAQNVRVVSLSYFPFKCFESVCADLKKTKNIIKRERIKSQLRTYRRLWKEWTEFISQQKETVFVIASGNDETQLQALNEDIEIQRNMIPHSNVLYVAALNSGDGLELYSNYGRDAVQIAANGDYDSETRGTSFAAPRVSGILAKIFSEQPELTAQEGIQELFDHHTQHQQDLVGLVQGARALKDPAGPNKPSSVRLPSENTHHTARSLLENFKSFASPEIRTMTVSSPKFTLNYYYQRGSDGNPTIRMDIDCRDIAEGN